MYGEFFNALNGNTLLTSKYILDFFFYDWRMSNGISAQKLDTYINEMGYDRVVLLAHSMGGLVASGYLALGAEQRNKVKSVYFLASPLLGSVEMVNVWFDENVFALGFDDYLPFSSKKLSALFKLAVDCFTALLSNYRSVYELIPNKKYFPFVDNGYFVRRIVRPNLPIEEVYYKIYDDTKVSFNAFAGYKDTFMLDAESFHNSLYINSEHISSFADSYYIFGDGESTKTKLLHSLWYYESGNIYSTFDELESTSDGDGLVVKWSAALEGRYPDRTYHIVGGHTGILKKFDMVKFIAQNILGIYHYNPSNPTFIQGY